MPFCGGIVGGGLTDSPSCESLTSILAEVQWFCCWVAVDVDETLVVSGLGWVNARMCAMIQWPLAVSAALRERGDLADGDAGVVDVATMGARELLGGRGRVVGVLLHFAPPWRK